MPKWSVLLAILLAIGCGASLGAASTTSLSGGVSLWMAFDPSAGQFDAMDLEVEARYSIDTVTLTSESVIAFPGTWVWQAFSAQGALGAYGFESNILFGASTAEYLYAEAIVSLPIGGIDFVWHAAQLSDAVFGGPEGGWALKLSGKIGGFDLTSITEFGARIEDEDFAGISIVHIATGFEQHYATDARPIGEGFTGQKISLCRANVLCSDLAEATLYITCSRFDHLQFDVEGLDIGLPFFALDAELRFELADKTIALAPTLSLGDTACMEVYGSVDWDSAAIAVSGIKLSGLELTCEVGSVVVRDVALFDLGEYVLTTELFGSKVVEIDDALEEGYDFYPDYWELLSIAVTGDVCCGQSYSFLANIYFDEASTNLFDWAMLHVEASAPLAAQVDVTLGMEAKPSGIEHIAIGLELEW